MTTQEQFTCKRCGAKRSYDNRMLAFLDGWYLGEVDGETYDYCNCTFGHVIPDRWRWRQSVDEMLQH